MMRMIFVRFRVMFSYWCGVMCLLISGVSVVMSMGCRLMMRVVVLVGRFWWMVI